MTPQRTNGTVFDMRSLCHSNDGHITEFSQNIQQTEKFRHFYDGNKGSQFKCFVHFQHFHECPFLRTLEKVYTKNFDTGMNEAGNRILSSLGYKERRSFF